MCGADQLYKLNPRLTGICGTKREIPEDEPLNAKRRIDVTGGYLRMMLTQIDAAEEMTGGLTKLLTHAG